MTSALFHAFAPAAKPEADFVNIVLSLIHI